MKSPFLLVHDALRSSVLLLEKLDSIACHGVSCFAFTYRLHYAIITDGSGSDTVLRLQHF